MKMLIQRVNNAKVLFEDGTFNSIGKGLLVYLGVHKEDDLDDIQICIKKLINLRIFEDEDGKINYSLLDKNLEIMVISNFSLYGSMKKGNRPSFTESAPALKANEIYENFLKELDKTNVSYTTGKFQTYMDVQSSNDGPMNFIFDTREGDN
ncbi:D-tyrosyl-tRNA(Tyr) deacylase [Streptobacillus felis]|uniref:D-aminoacyl-tRNA deacylase n=1 Tax=Streptobacillus felis TaxID=1384509 RepID=A0A7Z0PEU9_9FUSO|nr:D-aminoacyl-tRNA deacylase [Streptobacillus felis]NYV27958.1 D-tyrosyl-tRNA(Tyr) deacylase [Streptobacillus felis]